MEPERRAAQRLRPGDLTYLEFGEGIGGMVWDASENGLAFQAVAAVQAGRQITLCISPNPASRIELRSTVVWTDQSKKFGGLQFAQLSDDTRERIRAWLAPEPVPETADQRVAPPVLPKEKSVSNDSNEEHETDNLPPAIQVSREAAPVSAAIARSATPLRAPFNSTIFVPEPLLPEGALFAPRPPRSHAFSIALLLVVVFVSSIVVFPNLRAVSGAALIRLGEKLKGNSEAQNAGPTSSPLRSPNQVLSDSPPQAQLNTESLPVKPPEKLVTPAPKQETGGISNPPETQYSNRGQIAEPFARGRSGSHRSALAQQLWSNIGAGDVSAEIALAQLYLAGDGVPRSCEQARVLLKAASTSGDKSAKRQLHDLKKRGCR